SPSVHLQWPALRRPVVDCEPLPELASGRLNSEPVRGPLDGRLVLDAEGLGEDVPIHLRPVQEGCDISRADVLERLRAVHAEPRRHPLHPLRPNSGNVVTGAVATLGPALAPGTTARDY